jgi:hypothetical protein
MAEMKAIKSADGKNGADIIDISFD